MRTVCVALALLLLVSGCGGGRPSEAEAEPFVKALERHFRERSMEMKVEVVESLRVTDAAATAEVRVSDKAVGYGMKPLWRVTYEMREGEWRVASTERRRPGGPGR